MGVSVGFRPDEPNGGARIHMKGNDVFKYAVKALDGVVDETLEANGLDKQDLDWLIPHQANLRIIEATARRLEMPMDRVIVTVDRHGNTSAGSVPLALDAAVRSGRVQRGQLLLQSLSLGAVQIAVSTGVNTLLICFAAVIAGFLNRNMGWMRVQRYLMGTVLGLLALRLLTEKRAAV